MLAGSRRELIADTGAVGKDTNWYGHHSLLYLRINQKQKKSPKLDTIKSLDVCGYALCCSMTLLLPTPPDAQYDGLPIQTNFCLDIQAYFHGPAKRPLL